ncbi:MAG: bifunctional phosphoribosylaminoimidazolecarboxamide formyltransferase/IMP cyclohydrolase [Candidatus Coatesbacteria bacterium]|nr:MAG: bifunctional phosphoribosylaminoimidazolecarboxamide formyltransferase/IMP cyclohydrolase [Candidatus Coatesbacteria bacterium]
MAKTNRKLALISVADKTGVVELARGLADLGWAVVSTGGTATVLHEAGLKAVEVAEVTGHPEILDGRVKTLHPVIAGGILARDDHLDELLEHGIKPIGLVCCNLYPFEEAVAAGKSESEIIEEIDIGGVTLLRAAAKNHEEVVVLCDPGQYENALERLASAEDTAGWRAELALAAFQRTAAYDAAISAHFRKLAEPNVVLPDSYVLSLNKALEPVYGENPHQKGAFYVPGTDREMPLEQLNGPKPSYNNIYDLDGAMACAAEFVERPVAVIVKHGSPCGAAVADTLADAFTRAWQADPMSAYGGIVAFNRPVDVAAAEAAMVKGTFFHCVAAPEYEDGVVEYLSTAKKWCEKFRIFKGLYPAARVELKSALGGFIAQERDAGDLVAGWEVVTEREPAEEERADLLFAYAVVKHVRSNAIVVAKDGVTLGIGGGSVNRLWPTLAALKRAGDAVKGSVLASDGFFPMSDGPDEACKAGITAIIQPGGSKRDEDAIKVANEYGVAMVFAGRRHFKH